MKKIYILVFLFTSQTIKAQTFNSNLSTKLQLTLDSLVDMFSTNGNTKGISASVYCPGQGYWNGVSGVSHEGEVINTNMRFGIASNSKLFTAVTVLKLVEENVLDLDEPISNWLPVFPNITIRQ